MSQINNVSADLVYRACKFFLLNQEAYKSTEIVHAKRPRLYALTEAATFILNNQNRDHPMTMSIDVDDVKILTLYAHYTAGEKERIRKFNIENRVYLSETIPLFPHITIREEAMNHRWFAELLDPTSGHGPIHRLVTYVKPTMDEAITACQERAEKEGLGPLPVMNKEGKIILDPLVKAA